MARREAHARLEQAKYNFLWETDEYRERSPGMRFIDDALTQLSPAPRSSFLDIGCGTGRVSAHLKTLGYSVTATDISALACKEFDGDVLISPLWDLTGVGPFDYGFCADLMEHIPTDLVPDCLARISECCAVTYFQIANFDCGFGYEGGFKTHMTVKPVTWWRGALEAHFARVDIRAAAKHHIAVCRSKTL